MINQVYSLPDVIRESFQVFDDNVRNTLDHSVCLAVKRLFVTGCGDSHHASLCSELAFESLAGVPTEPMTALQFARYAVGFLPETGPGTNLVIGISVSGEVVRTLEALNLARQAGALPVALTATPGSRIHQAGEKALFSTIAPFPEPADVHTPGVRSYTANQLVLYLVAIRLGEVRGHLSSSEATALRKELLSLAEVAARTIETCDPLARQLAEKWADAQEFVFAGAGPNYGTALFSAAKVLEASGDPALGQEMEEWGHLQYFARAVATPTFFITSGQRDLTRAKEIAVAAKMIGRRVAVITGPEGKPVADQAEAVFPLPGSIRELFSPLISAIPGELFAAYRSEVLGEPFFRNFSGGRSTEGGGGISRIRTGELIHEVQR
jgi:glucosamine--fructose-6-phosphate aminotransferase (isomerizing)